MYQRTKLLRGLGRAFTSTMLH